MKPTPQAFEHLVTKTAKAQTCPTCGSIVLAGLDGGLTVRADPQPLNALGELAARLRDRLTYDYSLVRRELWYRTVYTIVTRNHPVMAAHLCGAPQPPPEHRGERLATPILPDSDEPPF
jgi:hypothetical protein